MNSCILMAEIIQEPQLRYTPDNQVPVAEMIVQFAGQRSEDPPATLKVVGWRNVAQEIQERCHQGDRVVLEGRLSMNTIDRPEGFKEKRAELTVQRIHYLAETANFGIPAPQEPAPVSAAPKASTPTAPVAETRAKTPAASRTPVAAATRSEAPTPIPQRTPTQYQPPEPMPASDADVDDIPF